MPGDCPTVFCIVLIEPKAGTSGARGGDDGLDEG